MYETRTRNLLKVGRLLKIAGGLLLSWVLVALLLLLGSGKAEIADPMNESCIRCHVEQFEGGLGQTYAHLPFYERRCTACHLKDGIETAALTHDETASMTGTVVDQSDQWQRRFLYPSESRVLEQFFTLDNLQAGTEYRFRISVGEEPNAALATSAWLGLNLAELKPLETPMGIDLPVDSALLEYVSSLQATQLSGGSVLITWQTDLPLFGWVELERLGDFMTQTQTTDFGDIVTEPIDSGHPELRSAEDLAIEACYDCHSLSELGTSHPVRLYSRGDVQIPDNLPTVDGMLTCVTCHDPHGSDGKMLVRETIKTKLCVACHIKFKNSSPATMFD